MMASLPGPLLFLIFPCVASHILNRNQGEACTTLYGGKGRCALLTKCPDPGDFKKHHPPICSFVGKEPVICCPVVLNEKMRYGALANQFCAKEEKRRRWYIHKLKDELTTQILGGEKVRPFTQVHMISGALKIFAKPTKEDKYILYSYRNPDCERTKNLCMPTRISRDVGAANTSRSNEGQLEINPNFKPPKQFVVGGKRSSPASQKHMAIIGYGSRENKDWGCGGSLINSRFILSAAHCANPGFLGPALWARLGDLDLSSTLDDAHAQDRKIVERILYPEYREPQVYHDIALFKLDHDVLFTAWVAPICLNTDRIITADEVTVTGWGRVDYAGATSNHLLEANLNVYDDAECRRLLPTVDVKTPQGIDSDLMMCAGKRDGSKDACSGDSGGPLVITKADSCIKTQVGITSYGNMCGLPDSPGIYTRVSKYIPWIEGIVFANETIRS